MNKYFYFYDLNEVLIDRYPAQIASLIASHTGNNNFIFIYSEKYRNSAPLNTPKGSMAFYIPGLEKRKIKDIVLQYPPIAMTTIAQRIPDMWMLSLFNHIGCPTFVVQHGLWSDRLERISLLPLLVGKYRKFINYTYHVYSTCKLNNMSFVKTLSELYRFLLREDIDVPDTSQLNSDMLRGSKAFIFDESWNDYYIKKYGYSAENLVYIGNPDYAILKNIDMTRKEDAVCYICQSLVEDGRYTNAQYRKYLKILDESVASRKKLYIKLHPRSRIELYEMFRDNNNVVFTNDLPACNYYIGHYSGLLATVAQISENILIWLLAEHHTPEHFLRYGSIITSDPKDIGKFISGNYQKRRIMINKLTDEEIKTYNPITVISEELLKIGNH